MGDHVTERELRRVLRRVSEQSVVRRLRPSGDVWVVRNAVGVDCERTQVVLWTCAIRGWLEVQANAIPEEWLVCKGESVELPHGMGWNMQVYRLTQAGWNAIEKTHHWVVATCIIAGFGLAFTVLNIFAG